MLAQLVTPFTLAFSSSYYHNLIPGFTLTTQGPLLKEAARCSIIKLTAFENYSEYPSGVFGIFAS